MQQLPESELEQYLRELPATHYRALKGFVVFLAERNNISAARGEILNSLPMAYFEDVGLTRRDVTNCIKLVEGIDYFSSTPASTMGVANAAKSPVIRTASDGQEHVDGLLLVPVAHILNAFSSIGDPPLLFGRKVIIRISRKKGVYREEVPSIRYEIRGARLDLLFILHEGHQPDAPDTSQRAHLSRDVEDINRIFSKKLRLSAPLIEHSDTSGYFLNTDAYGFIFEDFSTELVTDR